MKRSAGILLPISSLPSNYGIGTLGKEAYNFVDFLCAAKQSYWQILPIGPTGFADSPYQSYSSFAGNPYFIDLDELIYDGLLTKDDVSNIKVKDKNYIDYGYLYETRLNVLFIAYKNGFKRFEDKIIEFIENNPKIGEYALFMALKEHFDMLEWNKWDDEGIKKREEEAIIYYKELLNERIEFYEFIQYIFFKQFYKLKEYMNEKGIKLIGDIPIYVSLDSCDCWLNPECFMLDEQFNPTCVAGCPADYFSKDGQLWGNPIYNYENMKKDGYKWWIDRISANTKFYDVIRIDHFRGFESFWSIPVNEKTAKNGEWVKGPGMELLKVFKEWFYNIEFIAEDLGFLTEDVYKMLDEFGYPGMKVLQFGFDEAKTSTNAPEYCVESTVCYTGTHDNSTLKGWLTSENKDDALRALEYLKLNNSSNFNWKMIETGMKTRSFLFICQLQDYLGLDDKARINIPGTTFNNWRWRMSKLSINPLLTNKIKKLVISNNRA